MKAADSSSKPLLIVQEAELNRHLDSSIPITWELRRQLIEISLPLLAFVFVFFTEFIIARIWADGERLSDHLLKILTIPIGMTCFVFLGTEWQFRSSQKMKRTMKLDKKGIILTSNKLGRVRWERLMSWTLEPVLSESGLQKLTLQYVLGIRGRLRRSWSIMFKQSEQIDALDAYIEHLRETGVNIPAIVKQATPTPKKASRKRSSLDVWIGTISMLLLVHGLLLIAGAISISDDHPPASSVPNAKNALPTEFQRIIIRHFSSRQELSQFLLFTGGGLILVGGFLLIYGVCGRPKNTGADTKEERVIS